MFGRLVDVYIPKMRGLVASNGCFDSALVRMSDVIWSVDRYFIVTLPFLMCSLIMLNRISRCRVRFPWAGL